MNVEWGRRDNVSYNRSIWGGMTRMGVYYKKGWIQFSFLPW